MLYSPSCLATALLPVMVHPGPSFSSVAVVKYPDKSISGEKEIYFSSQFQVAVHHGGEAKIGTSKSWSHDIHSQQQREVNACMPPCMLACVQFTFPILLV